MTTLVAKFSPTRMPFRFVTAAVLTSLSCIYTLSVCAAWGGIDFSFDDSWIHLQYARTIFEGRPWEYASGIPSTGSSAPLWSIVLAPVFLLGYEHDTVVGAVLLIASAFFVIDTFLVGELINHHTKNWAVAVMGQAVFVLVPRNAGLMLSGMEAPLSIMMLILALVLLPKPGWRYDIALGAVAGLAYLTRPEFFLIAALLLPTRAIWGLYRDRTAKRVLSVLAMFCIAAVIVLPWVVHCFSVTGLPLADSYYSKLRWGVSDYDILLWNGWWSYWMSTDVFLAAGFVGSAFMVLNKKPAEPLMLLSLTALYRLTMPGMSMLFDARYLVPLFDLLAVCFVMGVFFILDMIIREIPRTRPSDRALLTLAVILLVFGPSVSSIQLHTNIHGNQASNIREMQWYLSEWVSANVPEDAVIASYDIGALGYLAKATVIDVYGLVTPEVLHNRTTTFRVADYLKEIDCDYVMYYVEWFPGLGSAMESRGAEFELLIQAHLDDNVVCGSNNMAVWRVTWT